MKIVIQRVKNASVDVDGSTVGKIDKGLLVFLGIHKDDDESKIDFLLNKLLGLRLFPKTGGFDVSVSEMEYEILLVSQFTLYADCKKGRRPDFTQAMVPTKAKELYDLFLSKLNQRFHRVQSGIFGANMDISLINDGPVTILLEN